MHRAKERVTKGESSSQSIGCKIFKVFIVSFYFITVSLSQGGFKVFLNSVRQYKISTNNTVNRITEIRLQSNLSDIASGHCIMVQTAGNSHNFQSVLFNSVAYLSKVYWVTSSFKCFLKSAWCLFYEYKILTRILFSFLSFYSLFVYCYIPFVQILSGKVP